MQEMTQQITQPKISTNQLVTETQSEPVAPKKSPLITIMAILLIFVTGVAIYFYLNSKQKTQDIAIPIAPVVEQPVVNSLKPTTTIVNPTDNWETYNINKYSLSFKYPNNWELTKSPTPDNDDWKSRNIIQLISPKAQVNHGEISGGSYLTLNVTKPNQNYSNLEDYLTYSETQYNYIYTTKTINNIEGHIFTNANNKKEGVFVFDKNNLIFVINWIYSDNSNDVNQILSTLKVTDKISTSPTWKTYKSQQVVDYHKPFTLHYPLNWTLSNKTDNNAPGMLNITLTKEDSIINIQQGAMGAGGCLYPNDSPKEGMFSQYANFTSYDKNIEVNWRSAKLIGSDKPHYNVCEFINNRYVGLTSIGLIYMEQSKEDLILVKEFEDIINQIEIN